MIKDLYKKRYQVYKYSKYILPDKDKVKEMFDTTFDIVASKQNLMPYNVFVLGPERSEEKKKIFDYIKKQTGGGHNYNVLAPYNVIFTMRHVDNPNDFVKKLLEKGHSHRCTHKEHYLKEAPQVSIEVGMFATILTGLCMENNFGVSYQLCFDMPGWKHKNEIVLFSMQFGYPNNKRTEKGDYKPNKESVIKWT